METTENKRLKELKKNFHNELINSLSAIIIKIETKSEITQSNIQKARKSTEGLIKVYQIEGELTKKRTLELLLNHLKRKNLEKFEGELSYILDIIKNY